MHLLRASLFLGLPLAALLLAPSPACSAPPRGWEPVPPEQLALARSSIEPGAGAEAIFWKVWVEDEVNSGSLRQIRDHYVRIKIYTEDGAQTYSKVDIDYPLRDVSVDNLSARMIRADGSVVALERSSVVTDVVVRKKGEGVRRKSFALPEVKPGCIVEYRYRETRWDVASWTLDLQRDLPVRKMSYFFKPLVIEGWYLRQARFHTAAVTSPYPENGYFETTATDVPAYMEEPYSPPEYQTRPWMLLYYTRETLNSAESYWKDLGHRESEWFDTYTKPSAELTTAAAGIAGDAPSDGERVRRLAEWIQREFHVYTGSVRDSMRAAGLRENNSLRETLRQKAGSDWDGNLLFAGLARALKIETRMLRVPSRRSWFFDRTAMLSPGFLSDVQVAVRTGGAWQCLAPATAYLAWDMAPWDLEGQPALFCDGDSSRFVETPTAAPERTRMTRTGTLTLAEDGTIDGDVTMAFEGHLNEEMRSALEGVAGADVDSTLLEETEWTGTGLEISRIELVRGADAREPLRMKCHVRAPAFATVTGKRILLEPAVFDARRPAPFTAARRRHPVYFPYGWSERDSLRLRLPEGWAVEAVDSLPPVVAPGAAGLECRVRASDDGRELVYWRSLHVGDGGSLLFPRDQYAGIKRLFDQFHDRDGAVVTLARSGAK